MLRLTILLIVAMAFAWETLGQDNGQLRPGLARAAAEGRLEEVWAEARAKAAAKTAPVATRAVEEPEPEPAPVVAAALPEPDAPALGPDPGSEREVVQVVTDPVFTLESFGNEPVPGEAAARATVEALDPEAALQPAADPAPAPAEDAAGRVWYVRADSVNVRSEPSTEADILDKLANGEALLVLATVDAEWTRIVIQGDGVEGYVATRFLSPEAP